MRESIDEPVAGAELFVKEVNQEMIVWVDILKRPISLQFQTMSLN